ERRKIGVAGTAGLAGLARETWKGLGRRGEVDRQQPDRAGNCRRESLVFTETRNDATEVTKHCALPHSYCRAARRSANQHDDTMRALRRKRLLRCHNNFGLNRDLFATIVA